MQAVKGILNMHLQAEAKEKSASWPTDDPSALCYGSLTKQTENEHI